MFEADICIDSILTTLLQKLSEYHVRIQRGTGGPDPPPERSGLGFLSNTGPDPLKNHNATEPAFKVGS